MINLEKKPRLHWIQIVAIIFIALFCVAVAVFGYCIEEGKKVDLTRQRPQVKYEYTAIESVPSMI